MTTTRIAPGLYRTADGHTVENVKGMLGAVEGLPWRLTSPQGDWMDDYATKREALDSL